MMNNLFSIFDTYTSFKLNLNWSSSILSLMMYPMPYWFFHSKLSILMFMILNFLTKEIKTIMYNKFNNLSCNMFVSFFFFIMINNIMGLFPYIFTSSSHMIFSISISLPLWFALMMFGWMNNYNFMFSHMIPQSTPSLLMPFMVLIESISNIIRPMTLAIRLTANMIAGHLLLTLLSQSILNSCLTFMLCVMTLQLILLTLEISVSLIQSYVFTILSTLYSKETN